MNTDEHRDTSGRSSLALDQLNDRIRAQFEAKNQAREEALARSREVIRGSANAIRAIHREEFAEAARLIATAGAALGRASSVLQDHRDILYAGFIHDAAKEYAEATIVHAILTGAPFPDPETLGVTYAAFLNGMGEAVGELRRHLLDHLRQGRVARCEQLLDIMDDLYGVLVTVDYPDAMTGGLRRTTDAARGILEKTRGDLTVAIRQRDLELTLHAFEQRLARGQPAD